MIPMLSDSLTIFEGPDGSGKSTAAKEYAEQLGAKYVHFPALPRVKHGLARLYVEAMLPALLGYQPVVFDRSWLSETPYGEAFREGRDRLTQADRLMLARLAMRCGAVVVLCLPQWSTVKANYQRRKAQEMLKNEAQLREVYDIYQRQANGLPVITYNFEEHHLQDVYIVQVPRVKMQCHPLNVASAGNWDAETILVGESFAERKDQDAWYQWPFASFSGEGCSRWLTDQLAEAGVNEQELLWINADQDLSFIRSNRKVIALGAKAADELRTRKIRFQTVDHPQSWKRFNAKRQYPLLDVLGE